MIRTNSDGLQTKKGPTMDRARPLEKINRASRQRDSRLLRDLKTEVVATKSLAPYKRNARTHPTKQIEQIANSIQQFGITNPLLIDENNEIIAVHGRLDNLLIIC